MFYKTQTYSKKSKVYFFSVLLLVATIFLAPVLNAQVQDFDFSGNSAESYQCFDSTGDLLTQEPKFDEANGEFYCTDSLGNRVRAVLKPPSLQQLEILFVRVVYAIWALVATFSFLLLLYLGYQYLISRGDATQIKAIRERIIKYIIGFILVFLAVPILVTFFKLLGVNNDIECYQGLSGGSNVGIGFQFFFTDLCTTPGPEGSEFATCADLNNAATGQDVGAVTGLTCRAGESDRTCSTLKRTYYFSCINSSWKLTRSDGR